MRDRTEEDHRAANVGPMVALVRTALAKPLSYVVLAIVIAAAGLLSIALTPVHIFPSIGVPVVGVAWTYDNPPPREMAARKAISRARLPPPLVRRSFRSLAIDLVGRTTSTWLRRRPRR